MQVVRQPPGTYTARGHSARVAPLFLEPLVAWLAHALAGTVLRAAARRDAARLGRLQSNLRKMVAELKACAGHSSLLLHKGSIHQRVLGVWDAPMGVPGSQLHVVLASSSECRLVMTKRRISRTSRYV